MQYRFSTLAAFTLCGSLLLSMPVQAQKMGATNANAIPAAQLEGVTLKYKNSSILVLSNATIEKTSAKSTTAQASSNKVAPTFLRKIGPYEIHKTAGGTSSKTKGQSVPTFAKVKGTADFLGAAYLQDMQTVGLISKEIAVKFKNPASLDRYAAYAPKVLVRSTGLYVLTVTDIYEWVKVVSRLQADDQVSLVEPQIVTQFATPK